MGIYGLHKNLKACVKERNLEQYRGQKAAVDTYAWLHKIIKGQSGRQIITGGNQCKYVSDCLRRIEKIRRAGVSLILVFDGGALPRKMQEEETRKKKRTQNFEKAKGLIKQGKLQEGYKKMIQSIDVSPDLAYKLIEELKSQNIPFIVAPYEADAQLAYLSRKGIVDFIITEDSDLLAFGAKKILFKLDFTTLNGEQICLDDIRKSPTGFNWFTHSMFLTTCIMSGCDYLSNDQIKGIGLKYAQKIVTKCKTLKKILPQLAQTKQIPSDYQENFMKAFLTFRFQRVYCPNRKECVPINEMSRQEWEKTKGSQPQCQWWDEILDQSASEFALNLPSDFENPEWEFIGKKISQQLMIQIAEGKINPCGLGSYDKNCLEKLKIKQSFSQICKKIDPLRSKASGKSIASQPQINSRNRSNILNYFKPIQRKNYLDSKTINNRIISEDEYEVIPSQEKDNVHKKTKNLNHKKSLKFTDSDSDNQIQASSAQQPFSLMQENSAPEELGSSGGTESKKDKQIINLEPKGTIRKIKKYMNKLDEISQTMFVQVFSGQYLRSPFS